MAKHLCPVCGKYEFEESLSFDICEVCGWEDDWIEGNDPDEESGANHLSLNEAKEKWSRGEKLFSD